MSSPPDYMRSPLYISYQPNPGANGVDIFIVALSDEKFYAFSRLV